MTTTLDFVVESENRFEKNSGGDSLAELVSYSSPFKASGVPDFDKLKDFKIDPLKNVNPYSLDNNPWFNNKMYFPGQNDFLNKNPFPTTGNYVHDIGLGNLEKGFGIMERYDFSHGSSPHVQYDLTNPLGKPIRFEEDFNAGKDLRPLGRGSRDYVSLGSYDSFGLWLKTFLNLLNIF